MGANIAGIYGAQIFRSDDRPLYKRGFAINLAIISTAIVLVIVRYIDDIIRRKKVRGQVEVVVESGSDEAVEKGLKEKGAYPDEKQQPIAV
jgi:hypothetical protein